MVIAKNKIHMIGIGGAGMSALASYLIRSGNFVTGSDIKKNGNLDTLKQLGINVKVGHGEENLPDDANLVIRSSAISDDNPELQKASKLSIKTIKYSEYLGIISKSKYTIAVAGTHGKTTTTSMLSYIMSKAGLQTSYISGSNIYQLGGSSRFSDGKHFIVEACEFDRSFLNIQPQSVIITNIEEDHLDYYKDIREIISAFDEFVSKIPDDGKIITSADNPNCESIRIKYKDKVETASVTKDADWRARNIQYTVDKISFEVLRYGKSYGEFTTSLWGEHNIYNALCVIAMTNFLKLGTEITQIALPEFKGTARRLEVLGTKNNFIVIDDYAHHPTEVSASLKAVKNKYPNKKVWCVFQPHQHSRTRYFLKEFAKSFESADAVIVTDIFYSRERKGQNDISSSDLASLISQQGKACLYIPSNDEVLDFITNKISGEGIIITMGAGDIGYVALRFLNS